MNIPAISTFCFTCVTRTCRLRHPVQHLVVPTDTCRATLSSANKNMGKSIFALRIPCLFTWWRRIGKASSGLKCDREYVNAPQVLFAKLQVDA